MMAAKAHVLCVLSVLAAAAIAFGGCTSASTNGKAMGSNTGNATPAQATTQSPSSAASTQQHEGPMLAITANNTTFIAAFEDNSSAQALITLLQDGPLELTLHDYGDFEKAGPLDASLPINDSRITAQPGDIILYQGDQITIYYDANTWNFTRLAHIEDATRESLLAVFGPDDVELTLALR